ncbi:MAG TPA: hypothetical protein VF668_03000 [Pyrinomonadaceae bacterium]|jgi:hypothetical protein
MRFGTSDSVREPRARASALLALICVAFSCAGAAAAPQGGRRQVSVETQGRAQRVVIVDGKEVRDGGEYPAHSKPREGRKTEIKQTDERGSISIRASDVELDGDLGDVKSILDGGYLSIEETRDGVTRRFQAEPAEGKRVRRVYRVAGVEREFDAEAKKWLSRILREFFGEPARRKP